MCKIAQNPRRARGLTGIYTENLELQYGEGEIRTLDTVSRMQSFQDCALNRSATSPKGFVGKCIYYIKLKRV